MKTQNNPTDTIIIQHEKIKVCQHPGNCPNHPNKYIVVESTDSNFTMNEIQQIIDLDSGLTEPIKQTQNVLNVGNLTAFDTIKPTNSKYLVAGDTRLTSEFIEFPKPLPETKQMFPGDGIAFSLVCGYVAYLSGNYINDCFRFGYWGQFFNELKNEWNS
jgi:hypothetical protein